MRSFEGTCLLGITLTCPYVPIWQMTKQSAKGPGPLVRFKVLDAQFGTERFVH